MALPNFTYNPNGQVLAQDMQNRGVLWQQPAAAGQNFANAYGSYAGGLGNIGQSMAGAYGSQAGALSGLANAAAGEKSAWNNAVGAAESARQNTIGNIASAYAADRGARSNANSAAEAARQGALGNIGSASLGAYGSAAGSALGAWASNQTAYNKSVSDMMAANQAAMSQYGQSRNQALSGIAGSYSNAANGLGSAAATPNMNFTMGTGGTTSAGTGGTVGVDGTVSADSSGNMSLSGGKNVNPEMFGSVVAPTYAGLNASLGALDSGGYMDQMSAANAAAANQLDRQHYSSRGQPSQMLNQALGGLMSLGGQGIGAVNNGMDQYYGNNTQGNYGSYLGAANGGMSQFYGSNNPTNMSGLVNSINGGYGDALRGLAGAQGGMTTGFNQTNNNMNNNWDQSLGKVDWGFSPWQLQPKQPYGTPAGYGYAARG